MKIHRLTVLVVDMDDIGGEGVIDVLETTRYPNRCIAPEVISVETCDVEWSDEHPLNNRRTRKAAFEELFNPAKEPTR